MLHSNQIFEQIEKNLDLIIAGEAGIGRDLWHLLLKQHPSDIAKLVLGLSQDRAISLFKKFPIELSVDLFEKLPSTIQSKFLVELDIDQATHILKKIRTDELLDLFEHLSDEAVKQYLKLLQKKQRTALISMQSFPPDSAGRIMNIEFIAMSVHFTIQQCIKLLQRLQPQRENLLRRVYVTNGENKLVGFIYLDDLVLNNPSMPLERILHPNELVINVEEDQEAVANKIYDYDLLSVPVVDSKNNLLGIITADDALEIAREESGEDIYKISGLPAVENGYLQTSFWKLVWQRTPWLVSLLVLQSISGTILDQYETLLQRHTIIAIFLTMLIGTGGNAGNQSVALVIRGLATGEMGRKNAMRVLVREFRVSLIIALFLSIIGFVRVYLTHHDLIGAFAVNLSLMVIVITSMMLGTFLPLLLERFNFDPAHSAAPFLATLTDIIGILIYCFIAFKILG